MPLNSQGVSTNMTDAMCCGMQRQTRYSLPGRSSDLLEKISLPASPNWKIRREREWPKRKL